MRIRLDTSRPLAALPVHVRARTSCFLILGAVTALLLATPSPGRATLTASTAGAQLSLAMDAADDAVVTCSGGQLRVNGAAPVPGPAVACSAITKIVALASGVFPNTIDLSGVGTTIGFSGLTKAQSGVDQLSGVTLAIEVDTGAGDDAIIASDDPAIGQKIIGGLGSDGLSAGDGVPQFHFPGNGSGEVDTITADTAVGRFSIDFQLITLDTIVDLNGGVGGDPLAIVSQTGRTIKIASLAQAERCTRVVTGSGDDSITSFATAGTFTFPVTIVGLGGTDTLLGGPRDEQYLFGTNNGVKTITDTAGDNQLGFCSVTSSVTIDLTGGLGGALIASGAGNTVQLASAGDTATREQFYRLEGGEGNDLLIGNGRNNLFSDCGGNDEMHGEGGNDVFDENIAFVKYATGNDRYEGGPGDDTYFFSCNGLPGAVTDTVVELPGEGTHDLLDFQRAAECQAGVVLDADLRDDAPIAAVGPPMGAARLVVQTGAAGQAADFEDVTATATQGDVVIGNSAGNTLRGSTGDQLDGGLGGDTMSGGTMTSGPGDDSFSNGIVSYAAVAGPVFVDLRVGVATGDGTDTLQSISRVIGTAFADTIIGRGVFGGTAVLDGAGGDDTLIAEFGDVLEGGEGEDVLRAGGGTTASGGNGNDTLYGIFFTGTLNGDAGDDTFILTGALRTVNGGAGVDTFDTRNEQPDTVNCGTEADVVRGDEFDVFAADCETVNAGPPPGPPDTTDTALLSCGPTLTTFTAASADGTRVVLTTTASLAAADVDTAADLYLKDGDQLFLLTGGVANVAPSFDAISEDGARVIFTTNEAIPGTGDGDGKFDVYQWQNGVRTLLTPETADDVFVHGVSQDATRVFFTTASALLPADTDANADVYERSNGAYTLLSGPGTVSSPPGFPFFGILSPDGSRTYFSTEKALLPGDTDALSDLYERSANGLRLISASNLPGAFGILAVAVGATADGSHVFFSTDKRLIAADDVGAGFGSFDLYERDANGLSLVAGANTLANLLAVSPDGTRVLVTTRAALLPGDTDDSLDVYAKEGGVFTLLSGGTDERDIRNPRAAPDATAVVFETDEALLPADVDAVNDVYAYTGGALTLLTPGTAEIPAVFRDAAPALATVFFRTAEALVVEDTDQAIDVYAWSGGGVALVAGGSAVFSTIYRGASDDGAVVFFDTAESLLGPDADALTDLYVVGPGGFPADPVCSVVVSEDCANCRDDDADTLVDRDDPDCPLRADGGGGGLADPKLQGKPAVACQKTLGKAGAKHAASTLKRLQKCVGAVLACIQKKPNDAGCLAKAGATCAKALAGRAADRAKLAAAIGKACGPPKLALDDLKALAGLGFVAEIEGCVAFGGGTLASAADVATCLAGQHDCRAEALIGEEMPRAFELMTLAGRTPAVETPCLAPGIDGGGDGLADVKAGAALAKCQATIGKAALKFVAQKQKLAQTCALAVAACRQQKPADTACPTKAAAKCAKAIAKLTLPQKGVEAKLGAAIVKSCGGPKVSAPDLGGTTGLGFAARAEDCAALGVPTLASAADVAACTTRLHECRAEQLLDLETPRLRELLAIGGVALP